MPCPCEPKSNKVTMGVPHSLYSVRHTALCMRFVKSKEKRKNGAAEFNRCNAPGLRTAL